MEKSAKELPKEASTTLRIPLIFIGLSIVVTIIALGWKSTMNQQLKNEESGLKYWPGGNKKWQDDDYAITIKRVFNQMSWQIVNKKTDDWDLMYSIEYPFDKFENELKNMKPHQRVNHIPGINSIAVVKDMATTNRYEFVPPAFKFPQMKDEFMKYVKENPKHWFVERSENNRDAKIVSIHEIDFQNSDKFVQRFINNPLLIDAHTFVLGVYVIISSIDPLRIYRYRGEIISRFCTKQFYPIDRLVNRFNVADDYKTFSDMPSLKKPATKYGFSYIQTLEHYLKYQGYNVSDLWRQVDEAIVTLTLRNEPNLVKKTKGYAEPFHFFELMRFDFIIDDNFRVHLMEAKMSPNLTASPMPKYEPDSVGFEQALYSSLKLIGAEDYHNFMFRVSDKFSNRIISSFKNVAVDIETCSRAPCDVNCALAQCSHCIDCVNDKNMNDTQQAYQEHMRRGDMMRIFPSKLHYGDEFIKNLSPANQFSVKWFKKMCEVYKDFC